MREHRLFRPIVLLILGVLLVVGGAGVFWATRTPEQVSQAQTERRCFTESDYCIEGRIREYWEQNGGLPVFGLPVTPLRLQEIEGQPLQVQWFERNRLELHPDNEPPYDVLLGRLGVDRLEQQDRDWRSFPTSEPRADCRYFEQSGQNVCGEILQAWQSNGLQLDGASGVSADESLALFGLPISPLQEETIEGQSFQVQWFERARFELHPNNNPPYNVQLGLLGREVLQNSHGSDSDTTAQEPPEPQPIVWPTLEMAPIVGGLRSPTHVTHAGDGSGRLFVVEQEGTIRILQDGSLQETPFLDMRDRVSCCGERGLLSVAFPPDYTSKGHFYINYTNTDGTTVVARYRLGDDPDRADPNSEEVILTVEQPYINHNGGQLAFGPDDGYLYIGMGDGGAGGDPENRAQNPDTLLGKLLRIDVESGVAPYAIPPDNPFVDNEAFRPEIWAYGLRNPWRFSFDAQTGDLYMADVGQNRVEEINFQPVSSNGGENYGWNIMEGNECFESADCDTSGLTLPIHDYERNRGNCSVTGGRVYRGSGYPDMQGIYYYADYCSGRIWGLQQINDTWLNELLYESAFSITTFGADEAGNLYLADYRDGTLYQVTD